MQAKVTKRAVDALRAGQILADIEVKGFVARRLDSGAVSYGFRYRDKKTGKQRWIGLGLHGTITADEARGLAKKRAGEVANSQDPIAEREETRAVAKRAKLADVNTVDAILDRFVARYVKNLRSGDQVERALDAYVRPRIGSKSIYELKRRDIVEMLDAIEDENGPVMADRVLAHVRKAFNWWTVQDEDFKSPIVRGMARTKPKERERDRALTDDEIRDVWAAVALMDGPACYPAYVRNLLLTATRRNESSDMRATEVDDGVWVIPEARYKSKQDHAVPLSAMAVENLGSLLDTNGFVFSTTNGKRPFSGFSKTKSELDRQIAKIRKAEGRPKMPHWTLHDLRRTARSLMSRAGVSSDIAEMVLGHKLSGVRGVYDRHSYAAEKRDALDKLAGLIALILNPPKDNVIQMPVSA
jgi:integrase